MSDRLSEVNRMMRMLARLKHIAVELKGHSPFTAAGALLGIVFMLIFRAVGQIGGDILFSIFHPAHVLLSAMVTASMFGLHIAKRRFLLVLIVGYVGSVGIATLSDVIIPHIGTEILGLDIPTHGMHGHNEAVEDGQIAAEREERFKIHLGFIEEWYLVNPAAILGIVIAFYLPRTKFPHSLHVLISTWASSSYLLMSLKSQLSVGVVLGIFGTLFIATWVPCCLSDIVFPLLFVDSDIEIAERCEMHRHHSHNHRIKVSVEDER